MTTPAEATGEAISSAILDRYVEARRHLHWPRRHLPNQRWGAELR
jgi:hypothetical protein